MEALVRGPILEKSLKEEQNAEIYIYYLKLKPYSSLIYAFHSLCFLHQTQNPVSVMAYEEEQYCLLIRILKPPPWKDLCHVFHADFFYIKAK